jgi:hypothetical protein
MKLVDDGSGEVLILNEEAKIKVEAHILMRSGGKWLGAARSYLQWHVPRGDSVTWASNDTVTMTVKQIEEMASEIAAAALNDPPTAIRR